MKAHLHSSSSPSSSAAFYSSVAKKAYFSPFLLTLVLFLLLFSFLYGEDLRAISQQAQASSHLNIHRNNNHHNNEHDQPAAPPPEMAKGTKKRWQGRLPFALNDEDEDEECDVFSGSWVRDEETHPLYQEADCPYIQPQLTCQARGRPDRGYQFWRWQPHDCTIPVFVP